MSLKKTCVCGRIIDYGQRYCDECSTERAKRHRYYDKYIRNKDTAIFYNSSEWARIRADVICKCKGLDLFEYYVSHQVIYADTMHHIVELTEDWSRRLDINNLFPLSASNHSMIHKLYIKDKDKTQWMLFALLQRWEHEFG